MNQAKLKREMLPEPAREFVFPNHAASHTFHQLNCIDRLKAKPVSVVSKEKTRRDPGRALFAIHETVVLGKTEGIGRGKV